MWLQNNEYLFNECFPLSNLHINIITQLPSKCHHHKNARMSHLQRVDRVEKSPNIFDLDPVTLTCTRTMTLNLQRQKVKTYLPWKGNDLLCHTVVKESKFLRETDK